MISTANSLKEAVALFEAGEKTIRCIKQRKRAAHCPPSTAEMTCHTEQQIYNFYTGYRKPEKKVEFNTTSTAINP